MNVNDCWLEYRNKSVASEAGEVQVEETKMAFYGGGIAVLNILKSMDPQEAVKVLESLVTEFKTYQASLPEATSFSLVDGASRVKAYNPKLNGEP